MYTSNVTLLIALTLLGSDSFRQREWAHAALERSLPASVPYLEAGRQSKDVEVRVRACSILNGWYRRTAADKAKRLPHYWIDGLPQDYPNRHDILAWYMEQAYKKNGQYSNRNNDWINYRTATRLFFTDLLSNPDTAGQVDLLLPVMRQAEIEWIRNNGGNYSPPVELPK